MVKSNSLRFFDPLVAAEWSIGMGLLTFGAMREANRIVEEVRDNNITFEVDLGAGRKKLAAPGHRNWRRAVLIALLLTLLLATLRWGSGQTGTGEAIAAVLGAVMLAALFWAVGKLG